MDKVAMITGAAAGIGRGIAIELAKNGYDLMIHTGTDIEKAKQLCETLMRDYNVHAYSIQADLMDVKSPDYIFDEFDRRYNRLDLYVNNAGITEGALFLDTKRELLDRIVDINYKGAFFCTQKAAQRMVKKNIEGNIIIIVSNMKTIIYPTMSVYGSIKAALNQLTKQISMELAPYNIRVNSISPGYVDSSERMESIKEKSMMFIPMKRWATVQEIGQAVLYLSSEYAKSITGSCIEIDGGAVNRYFDLKKYTQKCFDD